MENPYLVKFTPESKEQFRKIYDDAKDSGKEEFNFDGRRYLTRYAGYLLEYLDMKMPPTLN